VTRAAVADTCLSAAQLSSIVANIPICARGSEPEITDQLELLWRRTFGFGAEVCCCGWAFALLGWKAPLSTSSDGVYASPRPSDAVLLCSNTQRRTSPFGEKWLTAREPALIQVSLADARVVEPRQQLRGTLHWTNPPLPSRRLLAIRDTSLTQSRPSTDGRELSLHP
jgi:hypothetical protein